MTTPPERLWTSKDVATFLNVEEQLVKRWTREGMVPFIKLGRLTRYHPQAIREWIAAVSKSPIPSQRDPLTILRRS